MVVQTRMTAAQYSPVTRWQSGIRTKCLQNHLATMHVDVAYSPALNRRRAQSETSLPDQKSRVSHLSDSGQFARLLIATTLTHGLSIWGSRPNERQYVGTSIDQITVISDGSYLACGCCSMVGEIARPHTLQSCTETYARIQCMQ